MKDKNIAKEPILEIKNLRVLFPVHKEWFPAVDGVNLSIRPGEITGVVGESGSGKSVMSQSILRLRDHDTAVRYEGKILFEGEDLLKLSLAQMRAIRGDRISVIFQDPLTSLSPVHTVGKQLSEVLILHKKMAQKEAKDRAVEMLKLTGIPNPENCYRQYPYELSGGMQQRVMIATALACEPKLLIADEPTTALDVTIQEQILHLIRDLNEKLGMSVLFITHDMGVVSKLCHSVRVMYLGQVVELCGAEGIYDNPLHPYTRALLSAVPPSSPFEEKKTIELKGDIPSPIGDQVGCPLASRCPHCTDRCRQECPSLKEQEPGHQVACFLYES